MIKTKSNCSVCNTIKDQPKSTGGRLAQRIYNTRYYKASSNESLHQLYEDYKDKFSYQSLVNHCKRHQFLSEDDFNERHLRELSKKAEKSLVKQAITAGEVWSEVIERGMEDLKEGKMTLGPTHLLAAARDKSNFEIKYAGQQLALMDMVFGFASGERLPEGVRNDAIEGTIVADGTSTVVESGENRSRAFYQSLAGDASTPGAD